MRNYELVFVVDPRLSDEESASLAQEFADMLTSEGGDVVKQESWGKRKLAYPIQNLTEGRYGIFHIQVGDRSNPFPEVEQRMRQNEHVLRFLTVRTDTGRLRLPEEKEPVAAGTAGEAD